MIAYVLASDKHRGDLGDDSISGNSAGGCQPPPPSPYAGNFSTSKKQSVRPLKGMAMAYIALLSTVTRETVTKRRCTRKRTFAQ